MIATLRGMQIPVLATILLTAWATKVVRLLRNRPAPEIVEATAIFPPGLRLPAIIGLCTTEFSLAVALIVTATRLGSQILADATRLAVVTFFLVGLCALVELRERRPDLGCGCFGGLSRGPIGARSIVRAGLLTCAAIIIVGAPPLHMPRPGGAAAADAGIVLAELLLFAVISPETGEALVRLGYSEPCELRVVDPDRALASLHHSAAWRRHSGMITSGTPEDRWRELCWWYVVYPASDRGQECRVVFAVALKPHRPAVVAGVAKPPAEQRSLSFSNAL